MDRGEPPPQTFAKGRRQALDRQWLAYLREHPPGGGADAQADPRFAHGLDEYAQGRYHEAHETWEALWNDTPYPSRLGVQAFVKLATAAEHAMRGNEEGATLLARSALDILALFPSPWAGIHPRELSRAVERWLAGRQGEPPGIRVLP